MSLKTTIDNLSVFSSGVLAIVTILLSITVALTLLFDTSTRPIQTASNEQVINFENLKHDYAEEQKHLKASILHLKTELELHKRPTKGEKLPIKLIELERKFSKLEKQVATINKVILESPEKALEIPMLKREISLIEEQLEQSKRQHEKSIRALERQITSAYDTMKWVIGTVLLGLIGLSLSTFLQVRSTTAEK